MDESFESAYSPDLLWITEVPDNPLPFGRENLFHEDYVEFSNEASPL